MTKIISSFKEKPKLKKTWWTLRLGLASLFTSFLGILNGFFRRVFDPTIVSINVYRQGERTWILWTGFTFALLVAGFWIFMIIGELVFPH